jgi:hypothetical protein
MYPLAVNNDYTKVSHATDEWMQTLDKYRVDVVMWPKGSGLVTLLDRQPEWQRIFLDKVSVVYVRRSAVPAQS